MGVLAVTAQTDAQQGFCRSQIWCGGVRSKPLPDRFVLRHLCVLHRCFPEKLLMCDSVSGHMTKWIIDFGVSGVWAGNRRLPVRAPFRRRLHQRWRYYCTARSTLSYTTHAHAHTRAHTQYCSVRLTVFTLPQCDFPLCVQITSLTSSSCSGRFLCPSLCLADTPESTSTGEVRQFTFSTSDPKL